MKIIITGSLGHISKPLARTLVQQGHTVTVISSNPAKQKDIEALGAAAAIGSIADIEFLTSIFAGADVVYTMIPPGNFTDPKFDPMESYRIISNNYAHAIQQSGIKRVVHLSSIGAHMDKGNGILAFHYVAENILKQLPSDVSITFMRPVGFYYNMFAFIPTIKTQNAIIQNYGGDDKEPWVSPTDIADAVAGEIVKQFEGRTIVYVASDELSPNEVATILGEAIGKPDLKWIAIADEQMQNGLIAAGVNAGIAKGLVEMNASRRGGILYEDYERNKPTLGKVKLKDFAKEFAGAFNKS